MYIYLNSLSYRVIIIQGNSNNMEIFKFLITLLFSIIPLLLTSCTTSIIPNKTEDEYIMAIAIDKENLYLLGKQNYIFPNYETNDYLLAPNDRPFFNKHEKTLNTLLQSPYIAKITYLDVSGKVTDNNVALSLHFIFSPNTLTEEQQRELINDYGFQSIKDIDKSNNYWKNPLLIPELEKKSELLQRHYHLYNGKIIHVYHRQTDMVNYPLPSPIKFELDYYTSETHFDGNNAIAIVTAPLLMITAIPAFITWGFMCQVHAC